MEPKNVPVDIVAKVNDAVLRAMADPAIRPKVEAQGVQFGTMTTREEFASFIKTELTKY